MNAILRALITHLLSGRYGRRGIAACGMILALLLAWECAVRPYLAATRPEIPLPPSMLDEALDWLRALLAALETAQ